MAISTVEILQEKNDMTWYPLDKNNKEIAFEIVKKLEGKKRTSFLKALDRNDWLTSVWILEGLTMIIYKEGFYVTFDGMERPPLP